MEPAPAPIPGLPPPDDPEEALAAVVALRRAADRLEEKAVDRAVGLGWSWAQIAQALGVSRQAAHKKHAKRIAAVGDGGRADRS